MSEEIKVTIVIDDEKQNMEKGGESKRTVTVTHDLSMTLMSTLLKNNLIEGSFCGGRGDCGRCMVQFIERAPFPTQLERNRLDAQELRQGFRLACLARPKDDCVIKLVFPKEREISIVTEMMDLSENIDSKGKTQKPSVKRKLDVTESEGMYRDARQVGDSVAAIMETDVTANTGAIKKDRDSYIVAVDLGTTTIAMQLRALDTGETADTYCEMNPQRTYGADVLSRIQASCEGHREVLRQCVWDVLEKGVRRFSQKVGKKAVAAVCIAGNTTMAHLFMGYDVISLGKSPFVPVETGLQNCVGPLGIPIYITPGISAFVGGDIVAGLYALEMLPGFGKAQGWLEDLVQDREAVRLLIDLGTNGEMAVTDGKRMLVTATAAGPAFEGGTRKAVVGTDMIAVTASLMKEGILDETGLLAEPYFTQGVHIHTKKGALGLTNQDIRALQMAKAAVRAGAEILWEQMGRPKIEQVYLAGGFGYYLDVEAAVGIGLLPKRLRGSVLAVGNTSLEGAFRMGRDLYRGKIDGRMLDEAVSSIESINLAKQAAFEGLYLQYMNLCEN